MRGHPTIALKLLFERQPSKIVKVKGITDSGASSNLWSLDHYQQSGFKMSDLYPTKMSLNAANKSPIHIDGVFFAQMARITNSGDTVLSRSMVYISRDANALHLSHKTMLQLGIINSDFPTIGKFNNRTCKVTRETSSQAAISSDGSICGATKDDGGICDFPWRTVVPDCPKQLPFLCTPANNNRMRDWLLKRYASSTFNTCPHQQLP